MKAEFDHYRVSPFTVVVDPMRASALMKEDADPDFAFLFEKQLQEADVVCMSKADLYPDAPSIPDVEVHRLSAVTGSGVVEWLDEILGGRLEVGKIILDIDYARYAESEAALAWLNLSFECEPKVPIAPAQVVGPLLDVLDQALTAAGLPIVHMKLVCNSATGWLKAAICANEEEPKVEGHLDASPAGRHEVLLNLRAKGDPIEVRRIVAEQLLKLDGNASSVRMDCFSPAPPKPERRVTKRMPSDAISEIKSSLSSNTPF